MLQTRKLLFFACTKATSGNYEQYVEIDGIRYSHNIDPRTGRPVRGVQSVKVISPSAELSDALATGVTVMGKKAGLDLNDQLPDTHAILVDDENRVFKNARTASPVRRCRCCWSCAICDNGV